MVLNFRDVLIKMLLQRKKYGNETVVLNILLNKI